MAARRLLYTLLMAYTPRVFTKHVWDEVSETYILQTKTAETMAEDVEFRWDGWTPGAALPPPGVPELFTLEQQGALNTSFAPISTEATIETGRLSETSLSATIGTEIETDGSPARTALVRGGRCWVIPALGQSNNTMADTGYPVAPSDERITKYTASAGIVTMSSSEITLTAQFARELLGLIPVTDWICVVQAAVGSTGFTEGTATVDGASVTNSWDRTNVTAAVNLYARAVTWTNAAITAATALGATPFVAAITFSGFENDTPYMSDATFTTKAVDFLNTFRTTVSPATEVPIVIGSMVPEYADLRGQTYTADVAAALAKLPGNASLSLAAFFYGPRGYDKPAETIHYSSAGQIARGKLALEAWNRARLNRSAVNPVPPPNVRIVREPGRAVLRWDPVRSRATSVTAEFSTDGGKTWTAGTLDPDSRLFATFGTFPWQSIQGRVRASNSGGSTVDSVWALSDKLAAVETLPAGVAVFVMDGAGSTTISPTATAAGSLYTAYRLPASGGAATANARNGASTRSLAVIADQAGAVDLARVINASATITSSFGAPKATAGLHVSTVTVSADGSTVKGYRDAEAVVTTVGAAGATDMSTLATSQGTGSTMLGAVLFTGAEHDAATVIRYRQMIASRYGVNVT